jgi:glycosyltransferase involved in cell wall biosynthesis
MVQASVKTNQGNSSNLSEMPLVSVVLGNYNYGRFVKQSIDSVLEQSYPHIELIVIDDGSTDHSRSVIESCLGNNPKKFIAIFQPNSGQEMTFNLGVERSKGEIICFLDADDYFHTDKISKVVEAFQKHPEWVQIGHIWTSVDIEGNPVGSATSDILSQGNVCNLLLKWGKYASAISSGLACRRSVLQQVMPMVPGWGVDSYLNVVMPFYGEVGGINEPLMYYRMHGNNMRAHSADLTYLIQQREGMAVFINQIADRLGIIQRFDIQNDIDYLSYQMMQREKTSIKDVIQIVNLSIQESLDIGRSPRDTIIRLIYRSFIALFPLQGKSVLKLGFRRYITSIFKR